ncbi:MAG: hypothetical protein DMG54_01270 [Acidobacteria bacterium]|nr:MAG: hypothetical protein DMG54_01270 [Acidobacteriota bacterium]
MPLAVDAVIPVYGERPEALAATLSACLKQTYPFSRIFVVDDGSPEPISLPQWTQSLPQICLIRLPQNLGISAARNAAIACSNALLLGCINTQVLPDPDCLSKNEDIWLGNSLCRSESLHLHTGGYAEGTRRKGIARELLVFSS